jgi:hypothetical protein
MRAVEVKLGSFWLWFLFKFVAPALLFIVILAFIASREYTVPFLFMLVLIYAIMLATGDEMIYGKANEDGITFRRYFREQFVPWSEIEAIGWSNANNVQIFLRGRRFRGILHAQSHQSKSFVDSLQEEPEVVQWLRVAKPNSADGLEFRPGSQ